MLSWCWFSPCFTILGSWTRTLLDWLRGLVNMWCSGACWHCYWCNKQGGSKDSPWSCFSFDGDLLTCWVSPRACFYAVSQGTWFCRQVVTWSCRHVVLPSRGPAVTWSCHHVVTWSCRHVVTWSRRHLVPPSRGHMVQIPPSYWWNLIVGALSHRGLRQADVPGRLFRL